MKRNLLTLLACVSMTSPAAALDPPSPATARVKGAAGADTTLKSAAGGRPTVVIVSKGHWCPICRDQLSSTGRRSAALESLGAYALGLSADSPKVNSEVSEALGLPFPILSDQGGEVLDALGLYSKRRKHAIPGLVFLDKCGDVAGVYKGRRPGSSQDLFIEERLRALLAQTRNCRNAI